MRSAGVGKRQLQKMESHCTREAKSNEHHPQFRLNSILPN